MNALLPCSGQQYKSLSKSRRREPERRLGIGRFLVDYGLIVLDVAEVHTNKKTGKIEDGHCSILHGLARNVMCRSQEVLSTEAGASSLLLEVARSGKRG